MPSVDLDAPEHEICSRALVTIKSQREESERLRKCAVSRAEKAEERLAEVSQNAEEMRYEMSARVAELEAAARNVLSQYGSGAPHMGQLQRLLTVPSVCTVTNQEKNDAKVDGEERGAAHDQGPGATSVAEGSPVRGGRVSPGHGRESSPVVAQGEDGRGGPAGPLSSAFPCIDCGRPGTHYARKMSGGFWLCCGCVEPACPGCRASAIRSSDGIAAEIDRLDAKAQMVRANIAAGMPPEERAKAISATRTNEARSEPDLVIPLSCLRDWLMLRAEAHFKNATEYAKTCALECRAVAFETDPKGIVWQIANASQQPSGVATDNVHAAPRPLAEGDRVREARMGVVTKVESVTYESTGATELYASVDWPVGQNRRPVSALVRVEEDPK